MSSATTERTFTLDGHVLSAHPGESVLNAALRNGLTIPHLCAREELPPYGACGLCLVEEEGRPKLLRACSTQVEEGMVLHSRNPRVETARRAALELMLSDHRGDCAAPCSLACPAHVDCQGFLRALAQGEVGQAAAILREALPLPGSIGLVCPHPCERACRRGLVEEALAIQDLQVYAARSDLAAGHPVRPQTAPDNGKTVGVLGGGLTGLTAAWTLARRGYRVTVLEPSPQLGGVLAEKCPDQALLARELEELAALGILLKTDCPAPGQGESYDALLTPEPDGENPILAVARGRQTAEELDRSLGGGPAQSAPAIRCRQKVGPETYAALEKRPRAASLEPTPAEAKAEAARCLGCGCGAYPGCELLREMNDLGVKPGAFPSTPPRKGPQPLLPGLLYDRDKCILCGLCIRACEAQGPALLALVGRGFSSRITAAPNPAVDCAQCRRCQQICPTGSLF